MKFAYFNINYSNYFFNVGSYEVLVQSNVTITITNICDLVTNMSLKRLLFGIKFIKS